MKSFLYFLAYISFLFLVQSCSKPLDWPESPLYEFEDTDLGKAPSTNMLEVMNSIVGHYAHYDVVAYEDTTTKTTMRTFIISYGFTDFYIEDGKLYQSDRFVHAEQKLSRKGAYSSISDKAVQAIRPRIKDVNLYFEDGRWSLYREATPSLLGISGDPTMPLSQDSADPNLTDPDGDGKPGVTIHIGVGRMMKGEIYIIRREIFSNYLQLNGDGTISGYVKDESEQFVIGASLKILNQESNSIQHPDMGLSPVLLVPIDPEIDTLEELMQIRDEIFPKEPVFYSE